MTSDRDWLRTHSPHAARHMPAEIAVSNRISHRPNRAIRRPFNKAADVIRGPPADIIGTFIVRRRCDGRPALLQLLARL